MSNPKEPQQYPPKQSPSNRIQVHLMPNPTTLNNFKKLEAHQTFIDKPQPKLSQNPSKLISSTKAYIVLLEKSYRCTKKKLQRC